MTPPIHNRNEVSVILCQRQQCKASGRGVVFPILRRSTTALFSRTAYVVVYTKKNPKGEIQSRVTKVG